MAVPIPTPPRSSNASRNCCNGQVSLGYGLHLFDPEWFQAAEKPKFKSPTIAHAPAKSSYIHGPEQACSDDHLWLIPSICDYVKETGDTAFFDEVIPYCDKGDGDRLEPLKGGSRF